MLARCVAAFLALSPQTRPAPDVLLAGGGFPSPRQDGPDGVERLTRPLWPLAINHAPSQACCGERIAQARIHLFACGSVLRWEVAAIGQIQAHDKREGITALALLRENIQGRGGRPGSHLQRRGVGDDEIGCAFGLVDVSFMLLGQGQGQGQGFVGTGQGLGYYGDAVTPGAQVTREVLAQARFAGAVCAENGDAGGHGAPAYLAVAAETWM